MTETSEKSKSNNINELNIMSQGESHDKLKASLESSISTLESYQGVLKETTLKAKEWVNDAENKMSETAELIHEQFAMLREAIDKKEEEIMQSLEMNEAEQVDTNKLIHNAQELVCEIPTIIERVRVLFSEWDNKKESVDIAEEVLSIKGKVKSGEGIVKKLKTFENCETFVDTEKFLRGVKRGLNEINEVNSIPMKRVLCSAPTGLTVVKAYSVYVSLHWDKGDQLDEYIISYREDGSEWSDGDNKLIHVDKKMKDYCVVYPLKSETGYQFRVMGKVDGMETKWSEAVFAKTETRNVITKVESVVRELGDNLDNADECIRVLSKIFSVSKRGGNEKKALGECGAIDVIVNTMKTHISNAGICKWGCGTLCNIAFNDDNQIIAGQCGAIDVILNAMKIHINNDDVCEEGCGALINITVNADNKVRVGQCGAIGAIVNAMKTHINNAGLCYNGCGALRNITNVNDVNQVKAGQCGAIDAILSAMKTHINNADVCYVGCLALWNITDNADNKVRAGQCGAIDVIVNTMKIHINNDNVCYCGCGALCNLTNNNSGNQIIAGQCEAIDVIVNAMKTHINNVNVCYQGCGALGKITLNNSGNQIIAGQCGAIDVILGAMKTHTNNVNVCVNGCGALWNITVGGCGAIDVILNAMKTHINNVNVCYQGCGAIGSIIANNSDNKVKVGQYEAIDAILNVMKTHINDAGVCEAGCTALWNISEGNCFIQNEICKKGGLKTLIEVLGKYNNDVDNNTSLLESCCGVIDVILSSQETHSKFCTQDVLNAVSECYEKHKDPEKIKQFFLGLTREEDLRVRDAISRGVCIKDAFPKCENDCHCDENYYCHKCCVQQKVFKCNTCDKGKTVLYCEVCWKKHHQGHECEEFFYPVRCATK